MITFRLQVKVSQFNSQIGSSQLKLEKGQLNLSHYLMSYKFCNPVRPTTDW